MWEHMIIGTHTATAPDYVVLEISITYIYILIDKIPGS